MCAYSAIRKTCKREGVQMSNKHRRLQTATLTRMSFLGPFLVFAAVCQSGAAENWDIKLSCGLIDVKGLEQIDIIYTPDISPAQDFQLYYSADGRAAYLTGLDDGCHLEVRSEDTLKQVRKEDISNDEKDIGFRLIPAAESYFNERYDLCNLDPRAFADNRPNPALTTPEAKREFYRSISGMERPICDLLISSRSIHVYLISPDKKIAVEVIDGRVFAKEFK